MENLLSCSSRKIKEGIKSRKNINDWHLKLQSISTAEFITLYLLIFLPWFDVLFDAVVDDL